MWPFFLPLYPLLAKSRPPRLCCARGKTNRSFLLLPLSLFSWCQQTQRKFLPPSNVSHALLYSAAHCQTWERVGGTKPRYSLSNLNLKKQIATIILYVGRYISYLCLQFLPSTMFDCHSSQISFAWHHFSPLPAFCLLSALGI